ncbi:MULTISPECIES: hypothetical protein [Streptomyces]|uniref:Uncharacterized protein n=2 Tax=Streptomyces TaxID=1883 RepID=A0A2U9P2X9_STRAS|nr:MULTISPECIES: hypothetical protein [Streptomyces]AWT44059.1 hypothetical protein DMT42_18215 [Streptomyces actuosus]MBM4820795.1 hypothetical protein [Streptomyces actuosus]GHF80553.1 hypothetical protein GCM10018783_58760 [Streptomyces griseosporeus]
MIQQVAHTVPGTGPAALTLALQVAYELHAPKAPALPPVRPAEIAAPLPTGLRAGHPHRRKVPLGRLTAVHG